VGGPLEHAFDHRPQGSGEGGQHLALELLPLGPQHTFPEAGVAVVGHGGVALDHPAQGSVVLPPDPGRDLPFEPAVVAVVADDLAEVDLAPGGPPQVGHDPRLGHVAVAAGEGGGVTDAGLGRQAGEGGNIGCTAVNSAVAWSRTLELNRVVASRKAAMASA
jgi:hypothetical protein